MSQPAPATQAQGLPSPEYFARIAANYARQTGNTTRDIFASALRGIQEISPITKASVVHDNAAGPGTATSVIVEKLEPEDVPEILVTDNVPAMIQVAADAFKDRPTITTRVLDSCSLEGIPDNHFTHSILNFSVFAFANPVSALGEIHRTLKPGGVAAIVTWQRFGVVKIVHAAQTLVRPDLPLMKLPNPQMMEEGVVERHVIEAGFDATKVKVSQQAIVLAGQTVNMAKVTGTAMFVMGNRLDGIKEFMLGDFTRPARAGWTEEEAQKWPEAIEQALEAECAEHGGLLLNAWVILAQK